MTPKETPMRRIATLIAALAAVLALSACDPWGPGYCYGEGGQAPTCVSPGSAGTAP
jgi:hypothetical protein